MSTIAEKLEQSQRIPNEFAEGAMEVAETCRAGFAALPDTPEEIEVPVYDDEGNETDEMQTVTHPLHFNHKNHGLHAYRYEEFDDGSVVALWANDEKGDVKLKAFPDLATASRWSPRDER